MEKEPPLLPKKEDYASKSYIMVTTPQSCRELAFVNLALDPLAST